MITRNVCSAILLEEGRRCHFVGTTAALLGAAAIGGGGSILGSLFGGSAATKAAKIQADAATHAADLQNQQYQQTRQDELPWLQAGGTALSQLMAGLQPGGEFSSKYGGTFTPPPAFHAPTAAEAEATPGYQFTRDQGNKAILQGASASGGAFTGGTLKQLDKYNTGLADATYGDTFNRSLSTYQNQYNSALTDFQTNFNAFNTNQSALYNKLAGVSGLGQQTGVQLGQQGLQSTLLQNNFTTDAAAAQAAGLLGKTNAIQQGIGGVANNLSSYLTLSGLLGGSGGIPGFNMKNPGTYNTAAAATPIDWANYGI